MCQLLGVSSNIPVDIQFNLREFRHRGMSNPHGWGFAFRDNGAWSIIKKAEPLSNQDVTIRSFRFRSEIILGHVRLASCGNVVHENTHPFGRDEWVFAHNGTVDQIMRDPAYALKSYRPAGRTDSEYVFLFLLEKIASSGDDCPAVLAEESKRIQKAGRFNFIMSDGRTLYAYGDNSLYYTVRRAPFEQVALVDDEYKADLNEIKDSGERAVLVATEPFTTGEKWKKVKGLMVFRDGEVVR